MPDHPILAHISQAIVEARAICQPTTIHLGPVKFKELQEALSNIPQLVPVEYEGLAVKLMPWPGLCVGA